MEQNKMLEFSLVAWTAILEPLTMSLKMSGLTPVLAHFEWVKALLIVISRIFQKLNLYLTSAYATAKTLEEMSLSVMNTVWMTILELLNALLGN